jgi:hypothetical protein
MMEVNRKKSERYLESICSWEVESEGRAGYLNSEMESSKTKFYLI